MCCFNQNMREKRAFPIERKESALLIEREESAVLIK